MRNAVQPFRNLAAIGLGRMQQFEKLRRGAILRKQGAKLLQPPNVRVQHLGKRRRSTQNLGPELRRRGCDSRRIAKSAPNQILNRSSFSIAANFASAKDATCGKCEIKANR